jgi:purine-cytosine permease-like protein
VPSGSEFKVIISAVLALMMVNIPGHFVGSLGDLAGGLDLSILAALVLPAFLYPICLLLAPEPRAVYGPAGPRFARAIDLPIAPVVPSARE